MKAFLIGLLVVALAIGGTFFYRDYYLKRKFRKLSEEKYKIIAPLMAKVTSREQTAATEILKVASNASLRQALFVALGSCKREDLFPPAYLTFEKGAESSLVNWLEFPTELGIAPDEIELLEKVTLRDEGDVHYYAFRYRMVTTHWARKFGWMIGVAGPYFKDSLPYDIPRRVFSRFNVAETTPVVAEVEWVHANVNRA